MKNKRAKGSLWCGMENSPLRSNSQNHRRLRKTVWHRGDRFMKLAGEIYYNYMFTFHGAAQLHPLPVGFEVQVCLFVVQLAASFLVGRKIYSTHCLLLCCLQRGIPMWPPFAKANLERDITPTRFAAAVQPFGALGRSIKT